MISQKTIRKKPRVAGYLVQLTPHASPYTALIDATVINQIKDRGRFSFWFKTDNGLQFRYDIEPYNNDTRSEVAKLIAIAANKPQIQDSSEAMGGRVGLRFDGGWFYGFERPNPKYPTGGGQ